MTTDLTSPESLLPGQQLLMLMNTALGSYGSLLDERFKCFFFSLHLHNRRLTEEERKRFDEYTHSKRGHRIIGEFVDKMLRTSSPTALTAFALLYSDSQDNHRYTEVFQFQALNALDGIAEVDLSVLIELKSVLRAKANFTPTRRLQYPVVFLTQSSLETDESYSTLRCLLPDLASAATTINDLIRRGLLLPDPALNRLEGDDEWMIPFGMNEVTDRLHDLVHEARSIVNKSGRGS